MEDRSLTQVLFRCLTLLGLMAVALSIACSGVSDEPKPQQIRLFVSIVPQQYFVNRIGGDLVDVEIMVRPGQSPTTYEPTPKQMSLLSECDAFLRIGVPFEKAFITKLDANSTGLKIVDTRDGVPLREIEHHHEGDHGHAEGEHDPHIWLAPQLVKIQAATICDLLVELDSANAAFYRQNLDRFESELDSLDQQLVTLLKPYAGRRIYVYHPSYGYFADAYDLVQVPIESEGKEPGAHHLAELMDQMEAAGTKTILVQPQFSSGTPSTIAEDVGGSLVTLDPLSVDWANNLLDIGHKVADSFEMD